MPHVYVIKSISLKVINCKFLTCLWLTTENTEVTCQELIDWNLPENAIETKAVK